MKTIYIPDLIGEVVAKVNEALYKNVPMHAHYDWGTHTEVMQNLISKEQNPGKPKKWPLVWLVTPFDEQHTSAGLYARTRLHLVLAHDSETTYTMQERRDKVFLPILYPLYAELIRQFQKHKGFQMAAEPPHTKRDIQYAKVDSKGQNLFNDFVDVIDISDLQIDVKNIC